jgi:hypothetical protein
MRSCGEDTSPRENFEWWSDAEIAAGDCFRWRIKGLLHRRGLEWIGKPRIQLLFP